MVATPVKPEPRRLRGSLGAWIFSILAHIFILVHFVAPAVAPLVPEGYWVEMAANDSPAPAKARSGVDAGEKAQPATPPVGNTSQSTGLDGPVGALNGTQVSIRDRYLYELESFINQHKTYPARARHLGLSGKVEVAFHLELDGTFKDPHVVRPCIHDELNKAAVDLVIRASRFRPIPPELATPVLHVTVPIEYDLR